MKKKKRKIKKKAKYIFLLIIIICIGGIFKLVNTINYHKTYEYKFLNLGYNKTEFKAINKLNKTSKDYLLTIEYNEKLINIINEKYFIEKNLSRYLDYLQTSNKKISDIIAIINVGADSTWYTNIKDTDVSKGNLMLVNKFYKLDNSYNSSDMVSVSSSYSFGSNQKLTKETFEAFKNMFNDAKEENLTLIINSSFRSYEEQEDVFYEYEKAKGKEYAENYAAYPGHSEHQTGMCIDIQTYGSTSSTFEDFDEFYWLQDNAYKYGFILRYPKDKEYITGYNYESWHFRYVGVEVAKYIKENNITFDEYYAYFIENN